MKQTYYEENDKFLIRVECIIFTFQNKELKVLLNRKPFEPLKSKWSLIGGFMKEGNSLTQASEKILHSYIQQKDIYMKQVGAYDNVSCDSDGLVVSIAFYAIAQTEKLNASITKKHHVKWININKLPDLVFNQNQMIDDALKLLKYKVSTQPIAHHFFDNKFTLPDFQNLYENIYQTTLDKRNFRKKVHGMNIFDKLEEKDRSSSKRGAFYYTFNEERYREFLKEGKHFSL